MTTPLQVNVAAFMLTNNGVGPNVNLVSYYNSYSSVNTISGFNGVLSNAKTAVNSGTITSATLTALTNINSSYKPLLDQDPNGSNNRFLTNIVINRVNQIVPTDYTKFVQVFSSVYGALDQINTFIDYNTTANSYFGSTFTTVDTIITGGFCNVSSNLLVLGTDLSRVGTAVNLQYLDTLGRPSAVVASLKSAGNGYTGFSDEMLTQGVSAVTISNIGSAGFTPTLIEERQIYAAMKLVTKTKLTQILTVLSCTTAGLTSLDQVLDLTKMLPSSYASLNGVGSSGVTSIYKPNSTVVNQPFVGSSGSLAQTTTPTIADSNRAFANSLTQIKQIQGKSTSAIATLMKSIETTNNLNLIRTISSPVVSQAANIYINNIATGTGNAGKFVVADAIGSAAGYVLNDEFPKLTTNLNTIASGAAGILTQASTGVYAVMNSVLVGACGSNPCNLHVVYGNSVPSWVGGTVVFTSIDSAMSTLITQGQAQVNIVNNTINSSFATQKATSNTAYGNMGTKISKEISVTSTIGVDLPNITSGGQHTIMSWVQSIDSYAQDTQIGGATEYIGRIVTANSIPGQAIVASLIESRNITRLQNLGVPVDNKLY